MKVSNVLMRRRLFAALLLCAAMFAVMLLRLGWVQLWKGQELAEKAEQSWRKDIPFTAKRGEIHDRNGIQLAYNVSTPTIMAIPAQIRNPEETARKLAQVLGARESQVLNLITKKQLIVKIQPAGRKISREKAMEVQNLNLPGIVVAEDNRRYYPFGNLASHVLGFTGIDNQGLTGVELAYDKYLTGVSGSVSFLTDARGREMPGSSEEYTPPRDGMTLQLTIDKHIQAIVERELDQAMLTYEPAHAIAIAMDPNNGEVLAMASRPDFDPANYQAYPTEVINRNLPIWMTYEPGSTFKIITLAAALEEGKVDLRNEYFYDSGHIEVGGANLHCWKKGGHGSQSFLEGVENSCNPAFVILGQRLGKEKLFEYIRKFGFGKKTGIDLRGEENGILFKLDKVGPVELATTSFGQGVSVTPIQQITAVSAAINGGKLYWPHVAKAWLDPETGQVIEEIKPRVVDQVISPETSRLVREALESVVANGTGRNAYIDGYRVGGKTGTAQKVVNGAYSKTEHIVSFIGFAPADDPKVIVYVAVDNPKGLQFGGLIAAPIVKNILADTLRYMGVEPRKEQMAKKLNYGDIPYVEVPNLVGRTITDIYQEMHLDFQLAKSGAGTVVVNQAPKPGTRVPQGSTIRIYLSSASP
jgi:stage V sporulation protein D (sporulation-specific penicillin-binding protein)